LLPATCKKKAPLAGGANPRSGPWNLGHVSRSGIVRQTIKKKHKYDSGGGRRKRYRKTKEGPKENAIDKRHQPDVLRCLLFPQEMGWRGRGKERKKEIRRPKEEKRRRDYRHSPRTVLS